MRRMILGPILAVATAWNHYADSQLLSTQKRRKNQKPSQPLPCQRSLDPLMIIGRRSSWCINYYKQNLVSNWINTALERSPWLSHVAPFVSSSGSLSPHYDITMTSANLTNLLALCTTNMAESFWCSLWVLYSTGNHGHVNCRQ